MKNILIALAVAIGLAPSASAQQFTSAPETGTYVPQPVVYANPAAGEVPKLGPPGSNLKGGVAPAFSLHPEPADPTSDEVVGWTKSTAFGQNCLTSSAPGAGCEERKFRAVANSCPGSFKRDDPIRYWGQPGVSHLHEFFVSCEANAFSTYRSLRTKRNLPHVGPGGPIVGTGYWEPAWLKTIAGKVYAMPGIQNTIYYAEGATPNAPITDYLQSLHLLFRFIGGVNMDDPDDVKVRAEVAAANAAIYATNPSYGTTYWRRDIRRPNYICENLMPNGSGGWVWVSAGNAKRSDGSYGQYAQGFVLPDGTDPWEGRCGISGARDTRIFAKSQAPKCWDGVNVTSPDGYSHVRYPVSSYDSQYIEVCPQGWYKVPAFDLAAAHTTKGWSEYKTWRLASDAMMAAKLGRAVMPGESFHFDWMNGWNKVFLNKWLTFCMGIGTNVPHDCNDSSVDDTFTLITNNPAPDGSRNPQVDQSFTYDSTDVTKLHLVGDVRAELIHAH